MSSSKVNQHANHSSPQKNKEEQDLKKIPEYRNQYTNIVGESLSLNGVQAKITEKGGKRTMTFDLKNGSFGSIELNENSSLKELGVKQAVSRIGSNNAIKLNQLYAPKIKDLLTHQKLNLDQNKLLAKLIMNVLNQSTNSEMATECAQIIGYCKQDGKSQKVQAALDQYASTNQLGRILLASL